MDAETDGHGSPIGEAVAAALSRLPGLPHWEVRMAKSNAELTVNGQFLTATSFTGKKRIRHSFGRIPEAGQTVDGNVTDARTLIKCTS